MTSPYSVTTGPKQDTRHAFAEAVARHVDPKNILLMPGEDAHDARLLRGMFPRTKIKGIDYCEEKAAHIASTHWQCIDDVYAGSVAGYAWHASRRDDPNNPDRGRDVYPRMDAVWLDHTGGCTSKNVRDLIEIVKFSARERCILAATFTASPRGGTESADNFLRDYAWLDDDEKYDGDGQNWTDSKAERRILNTSDKIANAVRTAIDTESGLCFRRLNVLHHETYQSRARSMPMHFFILEIERLA